MVGTGSPRASRQTALLLILLFAPSTLAGCLDGGEAPHPPPLPPTASGPEPETIVTAPSGYVTNVVPDPAPPQPTDDPILGLRFDVRHLAMIEVPIAEAFVQQARAPGLTPQPYLLANGSHEGVTALAFVFQTTNDSLVRADEARPKGAASHLWIGLVVEPHDSLRHPDGGVHLVLLDAFTTNTASAKAIGSWSPVTRTSAEPVIVELVQSHAASIVHADGPYAHRITGEFALATQNASAQSARIFGIDQHRITGMLDLTFEPRRWQAGHGLVTKADPHEVTYPPAAGFARLESGHDGGTYRVDAAYQPLAGMPQGEDPPKAVNLTKLGIE